MPSIPKMSKRDAVGVDALYELLDDWFRTTNEATVGDLSTTAGVSAWVWIEAGDEKCRLHADTTREGVAQLLRLRREAGGRLEWHVVVNNRGNFNKIAFGSSKQVIPGVFLYLGAKAERGRRLV